MAEVIPKKDEVIHAESISLGGDGGGAETLADAGATIPQNTGDIVVVCPTGASLHMAPSVTPTSTLGQKITLGHVGRIPHALQKVIKFISDDASDVTCEIIYFRGAGRQDLAYDKTEPF